MSGVEDLNLKVKADSAPAVSSIDQIGKAVDRATTAISRIASALNFAVGEIRVFNSSMQEAAKAGDVAQKSVDLLALRIDPMGNSAAKFAHQIESVGDQWKRAVTAADSTRQLNAIQAMTTQTSRLRNEMILVNSEASNLRIPAPQSSSTVSRSSGGPARTVSSTGVNFVRVAAVAGQLTLLNKVNATMNSVANSMTVVSRSAAAAVPPMDRFRIGLAAPKVDPSLNVAKNVVTAVGEAASGAVNKLRGMADATVTGIPDTLKETAKQAGKLNVELDKTSATMSKHVSKMQTTSKGLSLLARVFPFASGAIQTIKGPLDAATVKAEKMAGAVDKANAIVAAGANKARNAAFVMTGSFEQMGGSADLFARANYHAMLPMRLMKREVDGANRVVRAAAHVFNAATHPIHAIAVSVKLGSDQFKVFRATLPPLTGGLQLGVRAIRAFSHATYGLGAAGNAIKTLATPVTWTAQKLWGLVRPAKAATDEVTTGGAKMSLAMRGVTRAADGTFQSLNKVASGTRRIASGAASSGFQSIASGANMAKLAVGSMAAGMVMWGATTAMATEKSNAVFGTMLHDMAQGKAVVQSLNNTQAASLFDNDELLNSGRLLFKAGVSADQLAAKTDQLATIAVATSSELGDITRIYQQGASTGSFGQDKINQLAERGVDIYHALTAVTGASGDSLKKMISSGQIGVTEMDAALAHLTTGSGIYAGAMGTVGNTTYGMLSQIKNNIQQSLGSLMSGGVAAFGPLLSQLVLFSSGLKTTVGMMAPVVVQAVMAIVSPLTMLKDFGISVMTSIWGSAAGTFGGMLEIGMQWATKFRFFFENFTTIAQFAFTQFALFGVTAFNDFIYFFTDSAPAYISWFGQNWQNLFFDMINITTTAIGNIATNIKNAMQEVWDFISSAGTNSMEFAWTPLLDGFVSTVEALPTIAERPMTELEKSLQASSQSLGTTLADNFDKAMLDANAMLAVEAPTVEIQATSGGIETGGGESDASGGEGATGGGGGKGRTSFAVDSLNRDSAESLKAIFSANATNKTPEKALDQHKQANKYLKTIASNKPRIAGAV